MNKKCILVITDGIGYNKSSEYNAFAAANKPTYEWLFKNAPMSYLKTSGLAVGLPDGQMGNSEVGHMTIGSGRILYQNLVKIDKAISDNTLKDNKALLNLINKVKRVHIIGLYSDGGVHSHLRHFDAVAQICKDKGLDVFAHAITDGRDVSPSSGLEFIKSLESKFNLVSVSGRFYAMDRDKRWDRVKAAYEVIANNANLVQISPSEYVKNSYENDIFDEFIAPASFSDFGGIKSEDGIVFINFRNDRAREICSALSVHEFDDFDRFNVCDNLITMTNYDDKFSFPVMFDNDEIKQTLAEVIAQNGLRQLHTAETEKYAHVTFFFNGGKEDLVENEMRVLIPSPKVKTYDEKPEMSAYEVTDAVTKALNDKVDFIVVNYANGDMVGHTGDVAAATKAVEAVDTCLGKVIKVAKENDYAYIQISDHGNCEAMRAKNGEPLTNHTTFDVFCFILADGITRVDAGGLSNVAPTILKLMGLEIPKVMDKPLI
ncbi:phosphoglycerate mutase [Campylobacter iguaniorum]|uniref:2,3-bisphosphoglycerate-independent phosphoglycerate mutase n=1 Tax=Campylobacter iguaniorum TaxID=1244531 RepID=A0A076FBZ1_9BACT|nr:2,3-bisphosphoglycerate-independent phosphoglycerate mutase [Campylobacter iguaniorum]AII15193.1 phosphoglycerate mutase [Campylobacter iguaniorum]